MPTNQQTNARSRSFLRRLCSDDDGVAHVQVRLQRPALLADDDDESGMDLKHGQAAAPLPAAATLAAAEREAEALQRMAVRARAERPQPPPAAPAPVAVMMPAPARPSSPAHMHVQPEPAPPPRRVESDSSWNPRARTTHEGHFISFSNNVFDDEYPDLHCCQRFFSEKGEEECLEAQEEACGIEVQLILVDAVLNFSCTALGPHLCLDLLLRR